ncbi:MAG: MCE family protein [Deltaproteobacteria bacterium]|nr:MCE family protein [Deltaproteobacteria bacterium]
MAQSLSNNVKVGVFAAAALAMLVFASVKLRPMSFTRTSDVIVYMDTAEGLFESTGVRMAGVKVGMIRKIELEGRLARVTISVRSDIPIDNTTRVVARSKGLLGERYLEIIPAKTPEHRTRITPEEFDEGGTGRTDSLEDPQGGTVSGGSYSQRIFEIEERAQLTLRADNPRVIYADDATGSEELFEKLGRVADNLEEITRIIKMTLKGQAGGNQELKRTLDAVAALTEKLRDMVDTNDERVSRITENIEQLTSMLNGKLPAVIDDVQRLVRRVDEQVAARGDDVRELLVKFKETAGKLDETIDNTREITGKINRGEGTIGKLINDDTTVEEINKAVKNINGFLDYANNIQLIVGYRGEEQIGKNGGLKSYVNVTLRPRPDKFYFAALVADPRGGRFKTTVTDQTNSSPTPLLPGSNTLTTTSQQQPGLRFSVGIGKRVFDWVELYGGLLESTGGAGIRLSPDRFRRLYWETEVFDFTRKGAFGREMNPNLRSRVQVDFWKYFYLTAGVEDILNNDKKPLPFVGGGIAFTDDDIKPLLFSGGGSTGAAVAAGK